MEPPRPSYNAEEVYFSSLANNDNDMNEHDSFGLLGDLESSQRDKLNEMRQSIQESNGGVRNYDYDHKPNSDNRLPKMMMNDPSTPKIDTTAAYKDEQPFRLPEDDKSFTLPDNDVSHPTTNTTATTSDTTTGTIDQNHNMSQSTIVTEQANLQEKADALMSTLNRISDLEEEKKATGKEEEAYSSRSALPPAVDLSSQFAAQESPNPNNSAKLAPSVDLSSQLSSRDSPTATNSFNSSDPEMPTAMDSPYQKDPAQPGNMPMYNPYQPPQATPIVGAAAVHPSAPLESPEKSRQMHEKKMEKFQREQERVFRLKLASNILFVLASIFYMVLAVDYYQWAVVAQDIPVQVLLADDDYTWNQFAQGNFVEDDGVLAGGTANTEDLFGSNNGDDPTRRLQGEVIGRTQTNDNEEDNDSALIFDETEDRHDAGSSPTAYNDVFWWTFFWDELPQNIQGSLTTLGYNEYLWDNNMTSVTDVLFWEQLTPEQQQAAIALGYTEDIWDNGLDPNMENITSTYIPPSNNNNNNRPSHHNPSHHNPTTDEIYVDESQGDEDSNSTNWNDMFWTDLPDDIRSAAVLLGYNEIIWDNGLNAFTEDMAWSDLNPLQQQAAETLGYNQQTWDNPDGVATEVASTNADPSSSVSPTHWDNFYWNELPPYIQEAASTLGYNEVIWDMGLKSEFDDYSWEDLTTEQQEAAAVFGYDEELWCSGEDVESQGVISPEQWSNFYWSQLPPHIQAAAHILGYQQDNWDNDSGAFTDDLYWDDLSSEQQHAAGIFGYTRESWNNAADTTTSADSTTTTTNWDNYYWAQLPPDIQASAMILGYNEYMWNNGVPAVTENYTWEQLTQEQQLAARNMGYNMENWNNPDAADDDVDPLTQWDNHDWSELPIDIQAAYVTLGYNETMWNFGIEAYTEDLWWDDLSVEQQQAANLLGYDQESWDGNAFWDDDYIFLVREGGTWVTREMMIYFSGALCFVFVGILDMVREQTFTHVLMIVAGVCGLVSAMLLEKDLMASNILGLLSVHFFLFEGVSVIRYHNDSSSYVVGLPAVIRQTLKVADVSFIVGSLLDVILSYVYLKVEYGWDVNVAIIGMIAAILWLLCSVIYITVSLIEKYGFKKDEFYNLGELETEPTPPMPYIPAATPQKEASPPESSYPGGMNRSPTGTLRTDYSNEVS